MTSSASLLTPFFGFPHPHTHILFLSVLRLLCATSFDRLPPSLSGCCPTSLSSPFISVSKKGTSRLRKGRVLGEMFFFASLCRGVGGWEGVALGTAELGLVIREAAKQQGQPWGSVLLYKNTDTVRLCFYKYILVFGCIPQVRLDVMWR